MAFKRHRHYGTNLIIAYLVVALFVTPLPLPDIVWYPLFGLLAVVFIVGQIAALRHTYGHLCEECIASMPLNPQERADKRKPALRVFHVMYNTPRRSIMTSTAQVALVTILITAAVTDLDVVKTITHEAIILLLLAIQVSTMEHSKYQPWCPYCHRGNGGWSRAGRPDPSIPHPV